MNTSNPLVSPADSRRVRLPDQITIEHGPIDRLGRYFLLLDREARARGLSLSLHSDFAELERVNAANQQAGVPSRRSSTIAAAVSARRTASGSPAGTRRGRSSLPRRHASTGGSTARWKAS